MSQLDVKCMESYTAYSLIYMRHTEILQNQLCFQALL